MPLWLLKVILYGHVGILIEFWFTGIYSLVKKAWKMTATSYLWMPWVYGVTALFLETISEALPWAWYFKSFVYVPIFYGVEALSGWTIQTFTSRLQKWFGGHGGGLIPWDYGRSSKWTPMGLVNLKYAPFWLALAMGFEPISAWMKRVVTAGLVVVQ